MRCLTGWRKKFTDKSYTLLARTTTDSIPSSNSEIKALVLNGLFNEALDLFQKHQCSAINGNSSILPSVLKACASVQSLQFGLQLHCYSIKAGYSSEIVTENSLLTMYSKCFCVGSARQVFDSMPHRDVVSWNSMISCYAQNGNCSEALEIFTEMKETTEPNFVTWAALIIGFSQNGHGTKALELFRELQGLGLKLNSDIIASVLSVCGLMGCLGFGKQIHAHAIRNQMTDLDPKYVLLSTALVDMYCKCIDLSYAYNVFDEMPDRNLVSWTAMISGCLANQNPESSLDLFREMLQIEKIRPNRVTLIAVLPACAKLGALKQGKEIHGFIVGNGFESDSRVTGALLDMYSKSKGGLNLAELVFERTEINNRDVVLWSSMILGYSQNGGDCMKAMRLFSKMQIMNIKPNSVTVLAILSVCTAQLDLQHGQKIHSCTIKAGLNSEIFVSNSLIDMYTKCGCLRDSRQVFDEMPQRDLVSWSSLISGYGLHGSPDQALHLFKTMRESGFRPDWLAFLAILSACNHGGLVEEGKKIFESMVKDHKNQNKNKNQIVPGIEHYSCFIDLLGRSGMVDEAIETLKSMPLKPSPRIWSSLVSACSFHGRYEFVEKLAASLIDSDPENPANYTMLAQMRSAAGDWGGAEELWRLIREKGLKKSPGLCKLG